MKQKNDVLMQDIDWMPKPWWNDWVTTRKAMLEKLGYELVDVIKHPSSSKRGIHVWLHIRGKALTDMQKVKLQYLMGDCIVRSKINYRRVRRGLRGFWNKLFAIKHKLKELPKSCQKCRIRKAVNELVLKEEKWE